MNHSGDGPCGNAQTEIHERVFKPFETPIAVKYWLRKSSKPPVIALHGWLDNAASFDLLAERLPEYTIAAMDFAGHGYSGHRPAGARTHFIDHVGDVFGVMQALGWSSCILAGHSMGAGVATCFAGTFPEMVEKLVLIEGLGPPATPPADAPGTLRKAIEDMRQLEKKSKPVYRSFEDAVKARMKGVGHVPYRTAELLCKRGLQALEDGTFTWRTDPRLRLTSSLRLTEEQVEAFISNISAPALLLLGESGFIVNPASLQSRIRCARNLETVCLPGGHHLHAEPDHVDAVAHHIGQFLDAS